MSSRRRFLMCEPSFFGVEYVINPWMEGNVGRTRPERAAAQWDALREALSSRAEIEVAPAASGLPDMAFAANAGLIRDDLVILPRFRHPQRQPETARYADWFRSRGMRLISLPGQFCFEGEGDALFQPGRPLLWFGYGVRSSLLAARPLAETLRVEVIPLRLVDQRFYHLDTCFAPLPGDRAAYFPDAFDHDSLQAIRERFAPENRLEVAAEEALQLACNAIVVNRTVITHHAGAPMRERLAEWGFTPVVIPLDEFLHAGGAAKCLVLQLDHESASPSIASVGGETAACEEEILAAGHLLDRGIVNQMLDTITNEGCEFEVRQFQAGQRHEEISQACLRIVAPSRARLDQVLARLVQMGAQSAAPESDATLREVEKDGVAPDDFYSTTIYPTDIRVGGCWIRATGQRMDAVVVVGNDVALPTAACRLIRDLRMGERVVCGFEGIRLHTRSELDKRDDFAFMGSAVSSERRAERAADDLAWEMRRIRDRGGRIVVVAGPVVIHAGGGPYLARMIRAGYVQVLLGGNAVAVHDIESALFGTSLGINLRRGSPSPHGHIHHLRAINTIRSCGGIAEAVRQGVLREGVMYECIKHAVPFSLAGSIRDDGPLPETRMDLIEAQAEAARLIQGADLVLMLSSMLHSIGIGNMTPAGVRLVCVDINPAVITKLADRGSLESVGIVTDVGLFLRLLANRLLGPGQDQTSP